MLDVDVGSRDGLGVSVRVELNTRDVPRPATEEVHSDL